MRTPAAVGLLSPIVMGQEVAHLTTEHALGLSQRKAFGPVVVQLVPGGDPVAMVAHHRTAVSLLGSVGLLVPSVEPAAAVAELDRVHHQVVHGVIAGTVPWLVARQRWRHPQTVTTSTRPRDVERQIRALLPLLARPHRRAVAAALTAHRTSPRPRAVAPVLPARLPAAPPEAWPGR